MPDMNSAYSLTQIIFYLVFLGQILLVSLHFPRRVLSSRNHVLKTYPPSEYPKLYPRPIEHYNRAARIFRNINRVILLVGLALIAVLFGVSGLERWEPSSGLFSLEAIVMGYFFLQFFPMMLLDVWSFRHLRRMRDAASIRKAELRPRRLFDLISPVTLGAAVLVYFGFVAFIAYINTFDFDWFGGYWNVLGITVMNLFFGSIVYWNIYGKKLNPHQTGRDRKRQIETLANAMVFISIAATLFVALSVILSALELRNLEPIATSLYFQSIAVLCFQTYRIDKVDFEVYREDPMVA